MAFASDNSIDLTPAIAYQGQLAEPAVPHYCRSGFVEGAGVVAGIPLMRGTDPDRQVKVFASTDVPSAQNFAGVGLLSTSRSFDEINTDLDAGACLDVMRFGTVYMTFAATVSAGQSVKMKSSDLTLEGFSEGADPGAGYVALPGLRIAKDRTGAGVTIVEVGLMGAAGGGAEDNGGAAIRVANIPVGPVARASIGTDAASTAGTVYFSDLILDAPKVATGIGMLNGTTVGTDDVIYALFDEAGNRLATTALAGTLSAGADVFQEIAFTAPVSLAPGRYWIAFQVEGATAAHQTIATLTYLNSTGSVAGVFGTIPAAITPTTSTTAGVGPIGYLYT